MSKRILLVITGSVAAYKAIEIARLLQKKSYDVSCILTNAAQNFVTKLQVASVLKNNVYCELFSRDDVDGMTHIRLSRDNDLILVAPATADFIAKIANGYADDLASTVLLASDKDIIMAPAMNHLMWENKITKENIVKLISRDIAMIEPIKDELACQEIGYGKMCEPSDIVSSIDDYFESKKKLRGKKVLVTGGGTREYIDPIRYIGNDSSGIQAIEIAKALKLMGADVIFVAANIFMKIPLSENKIYHVKNSEEMFNVVKELISGVDIFIGCAAVSDYRVENYSNYKIKKESHERINIELVRNVDILDFVANESNIRPKIVVGFAAETQDVVENGKAKLLRKNCDLIVANDVENGNIFGSSESLAYIISPNEIDDLGKISKKNLAKKIAEKISIIASVI